MTGVSRYVPQICLSVSTISPMVAPVFTSSMVIGMIFWFSSLATRCNSSKSCATFGLSRSQRTF